MISFGTFMQAVGSAPAMGKGSTGTGNPAATDNGSTQAGGDAPDSFSAWVRKLSGEETAKASDGEVSDQLRTEITESEATELKAIDWEQLSSMIADAMELSSDLSEDGLSVDGVDLSGLQDALQQMANGDSPKGKGRSLQVLANLVMGSVNGSDQVAEPGDNTMAAVQQMLGIGQRVLANGKGVNDQEIPGPGLEGKAHGKGDVVPGAMAENNAKSGLAAATQPGLGTADFAERQDAMNPAEFKQTLQTQQDKERPFSPVDPTVAQPSEAAEEESFEVNAQHLKDGTKKAGRGDAFLSSQKDSPQTQQSLSASTGKDDRNLTSADEDSPDKRHVVRSEMQDKNQAADAGEKELPKGTTSSDPVKTASPEQNRFSDTIQDASRSMNEKSGTIHQTAPPERTEASAAQRFQTTVMEQIVDKANLRSVQGRSEIQIRLKPEFLGNVQMNIASDKEQLVVRMTTDHPVVKEVVEANLHHLKTELQHQGLTIDRFEVTVNPDAGQQQNREQFAQMFKNPSFQNGQGQDPEAEPEPHHRENGNREDSHGRGGDQPKEQGINYFA